MADLVFRAPPATAGELVFGADDAPAPTSLLSGDAAVMPRASGVVYAWGAPPMVMASVALSWAAGTGVQHARGVGAGRAGHEVVQSAGARTVDGSGQAAQAAVRSRDGARDAAVVRPTWRDLPTGAAAVWALITRPSSPAAAFASIDAGDGAAEMHSLRATTRDAGVVQRRAVAPARDGTREAVVRGARWRRRGLQVERVGVAAWADGAVLISHGGYLRPAGPGAACCVVGPDLVFRSAWATDGALLFRCDLDPFGDEPPPAANIIIPVRGEYYVTNTVSLARGATPLQFTSMSLAIDHQSWNWSFRATLPGSEAAFLEPASADAPVLLTASVNGLVVHVEVKRARQVSFGASLLTVSGYGRAAVLDDEWTPASAWTQPQDRTAAQLAGAALAGTGYGLDWQIDDWVVAGGALRVQGAPIAVVRAVATAGGGYVQASGPDASLSVLPLYPALPWAWPGITPDIDMTADPVRTEATEWVRRPAYDLVYLCGTQSGGDLYRVLRDGRAGDTPAAMVVDPLSAHPTAARHRGGAVLADTGPQVRSVLGMPVLPETGVVLPGRFIRYTDSAGQARIGLSRSVSVSVEFPDVWQSVGVESHGWQ